MRDSEPGKGHEVPDESCSGGPPLHASRDEQRLLEYLDGQLAGSEKRTLESHLASCAQCRRLAEQWRALDGRLTEQLRAPALPPGFAQRIWSAIGTTETTAHQPTPARSQQPLEAEWAATWAQQRRRFLWTQLPGALDKFGFTFSGALAACLFWWLAARFLNLQAPASQLISQPWVFPFGLGLTTLVLFGTVGLAAKRPLVRLLARL